MEGLEGERLVVGLQPMEPGRDTWDRPPMDPPSERLAVGVPLCIVSWVASEGMGSVGSDPRLLTLTLGTRNVTSLAGKEPELVREVETDTEQILSDRPRHTAWAVEPPISRGAGPYFILELPVGRDGEQVWASLLPPFLAPTCWGSSQLTKG